MIISLSSQVSKEDEGKQVDSRCHRLTASFIRHRHKSDSSVPICLFYEVGYPACTALVSIDGRSIYHWQEFDERGRRQELPPGIYDLV